VQKWSQRSSPKNKRTREFLASKPITVPEHPPYSPDLAPSDLLFPKIKEIFKGRHFDDISSECHSTKTSSKIVSKGGLGTGIDA
jgi:transposase